MGCGCGASVVRSTPSAASSINRQAALAPVGDCPYTMSQLQAWLQQLICCKDTGLYVTLGIAPATMNKYLGIVMSALNYPTNPCYFQAQLGPIQNLIILIANTGQC